jgi:hypothetical protein
VPISFLLVETSALEMLSPWTIAGSKLEVSSHRPTFHVFNPEREKLHLSKTQIQRVSEVEASILSAERIHAT